MKIVFATNNLNKLEEIRNLVPENIKIIGLNDIQCIEELPETQLTLEGNALQKANYIYSKYGFNCFADDTGLEIDALGGEPGVFSARYAGEACKAEDNMRKVLDKLKGEKVRSAKFRTVIALIIKGKETFFEGKFNGSITKIMNGAEGFGYDPIFRPFGYDLTFAEMTKAEKGAISHRGKAVEKLILFIASTD
jgi:XTP/dITP diphosphohydrolase